MGLRCVALPSKCFQKLLNIVKSYGFSLAQKKQGSEAASFTAAAADLANKMDSESKHVPHN